MKKIKDKLIDYFFDSEEQYRSARPFLIFIIIMFFVILFTHFLAI